MSDQDQDCDVRDDGRGAEQQNGLMEWTNQQPEVIGPQPGLSEAWTSHFVS